MKLFVSLLLSVASGLGMGLLTYDLQVPLLALVAWAPAVVAQHRLWPERWRGVAMGTTWFAYLAVAFAPKLTPELGWWAWCLPVGIGLLVSLLDKTKVAKARATGYRLFWWQEAFAVAAIEVGRSFIPAVGTWTMAGYSLTASDGWRSVAGWVGVTGLSLAVWACNYAVAYLVLHLLKAAPWRPITGWIARGVVVLSLAVTLLLPAPALNPQSAGAPQSAPALATGASGASQSASAPTAGASGASPAPATPGSLRVAAIQVGFDLYVEPWYDRLQHGDLTELSQELLMMGAELTREAAATGARLVVWPEGFLRVIPQESPAFKGALEALAKETNVVLAVGYAIETPDGRRNEVALITPSGEWAVTAKDHPVPWAESGSVTKGQVATVTLGGAKIGAIICYDADFTDTARERAAEGLNLLVASAHDWPSIGEARATHLQMRAAENRLPAVMADWQIGSVVIDGSGAFVAEMDHSVPTRGVLVADVPLGPGVVTRYGELGDLVGWISIGGFVLALLLEGRLLRRGRLPVAAKAA